MNMAEDLLRYHIVFSRGIVSIEGMDQCRNIGVWCQIIFVKVFPGKN